MTQIETSIENAYRAKVAERPYCSISVTYLCECAGVTRKAFYRCFKGKNDVLRHVFDRDVVASQVELCRLLSFEKMAAFAPEMERHIFQAVYADKTFYHDVAVCPQGGKEAFAEVMASAFEKFNRIMLKEYGYKGEGIEVDYITSFFAQAKAHMLLKWVSEDYPLSPEEASALYGRMALPFWRSII